MATTNTSLAVKYRPQTWSEVQGQDTVKQILQHQLETKTFKQGYLFCVNLLIDNAFFECVFEYMQQSICVCLFFCATCTKMCVCF